MEDTMARVFIIWEEVPESTKFYVADLEGAALKKALRAQGQFVGSTENPADADYLSDKILPKLTELDGSAAFDVKDLGIDHIVHCGFLL
jgi:hypothetical protein